MSLQENVVELRKWRKTPLHYRWDPVSPSEGSPEYISKSKLELKLTPSHTEVTISEVGTANKNKLLVKIPRPYHVHLTRITEESVGISKRSGWLRHILDHFAAELRGLKQNTTPPSWRSATLNCLIVRAFHCIPDDDEELLKRIFRILALLGDCKGTRRMTESNWICLYQRDLVDSPAFTAGEPEAAVGMTPEVPPQILKQGPAHNRYTAENSRKRKRQESMVPESQTPPSNKDPTPGTQAEDVQYSPYVAGCKWNSRDWTCSYDAVFMTFWTLYEQSSPTWRERWKQHSLKWNIPLSEGFDNLICLISQEPKSLTKSFSHHRDSFRDQLSARHPEVFKRRGQVEASALKIVQLIFGPDADPWVEQLLVCSACKAQKPFRRVISLLSSNSEEPPFLDTLLEDTIQRYKDVPPRKERSCASCREPNQVGGLTTPDFPWIWFGRAKFVISLTITLYSSSPPLTYHLHAIIYHGDRHFTMRFRDKEDLWWKHDGRLFSGVPQLEGILSTEGLWQEGNHSADVFIYRPGGSSGL